MFTSPVNTWPRGFTPEAPGRRCGRRRPEKMPSHSDYSQQVKSTKRNPFSQPKTHSVGTRFQENINQIYKVITDNFARPSPGADKVIFWKAYLGIGCRLLPQKCVSAAWAASSANSIFKQTLADRTLVVFRNISVQHRGIYHQKTRPAKNGPALRRIKGHGRRFAASRALNRDLDALF